MARYRDLGPTALIKAGPDRSGRNPNNWTIVFGPQALNCKVSQAEIYQIAIDGPIGSSLAIYRGKQLWNNVVQGWANNYDPNNPLYIRQGDTLFFFWDADASVWLPAPTAICWIRYDLDYPGNQETPR